MSKAILMQKLFFKWQYLCCHSIWIIPPAKKNVTKSSFANLEEFTYFGSLLYWDFYVTSNDQLQNKFCLKGKHTLYLLLCNIHIDVPNFIFRVDIYMNQTFSFETDPLFSEQWNVVLCFTYDKKHTDLYFKFVFLQISHELYMV